MDLSQLLTPEQYRAARTTVYPSEQSLAWAIRQNKPALVQAGALSRPTGRNLINPPAFDAVMAEVGTRRAGRALTR